jgi:NTE family protein
MKWMDKRIGLALGGGGARGLAHIGVLKVLEEEAIPIDIIVGTSAGALIGGAYAAGLSPEELMARADEYLNSPEFQSSTIKAIEDVHSKGDAGLAHKIQAYVKNRFYLAQAMFKPALLSSEEFQSMIDFFIPDISVEDTRIPFRAVATDLVTGTQVVFSSGPLRQAVMASCAVPGAIEPLQDGTRCLSDGGIICLVPSSEARKAGADIVVAVAVDRDICTAAEFHTCREVYDRAVAIMSNKLENYELQDADIVIRPDVGDLHWSDFSHARDLILQGETATREHIDAIRSAMPVIKRWFTLKQLARNHHEKTH